ncbi:MAG TPA: hypothetical protein VL994_03980, partial [Steroidobacteraceae bacterium]|nr:hypothetical protein [Steroidobacteraceae bacterium]
VQEQEKFEGVQRKWDEDERKRDAETEVTARSQTPATAVMPPEQLPSLPEVPGPFPPEAPPVVDHPGSLTAFEHPLEGYNAGFAMEESSLHQVSALPEGVEVSTYDPEAAFEQQAGSEFRDVSAGGLGRGSDSYASTEGPEIPAPLYELNEQEPPPPPPPPPEEDPQKGRSH